MARPTNSPSLWQQAEQMQWLMRYPALTVMVFLRPDLGYRLVSPLHLLTTGIVVTFAAAFVQAYNRTVSIDDLIVFLIAAFVVGTGQRLRRWWQINHGICHHSYYIGTSLFDSPRLPAFCRRHRRIGRIVDPTVCTLIGLALLDESRALALWLVFAGICLRGFEDAVFRKERNIALDTVDGIIVAEVQGRTVEAYENPPAASPKHQTVGIPTGLAPDVRQNMKRRKAK